MTTTALCTILFILIMSEAFLVTQKNKMNKMRKKRNKYSWSLSMNFWSNLLKEAFDNEGSLPADKSDGQLDEGFENEYRSSFVSPVQERWRQQTKYSRSGVTPINENLLIGSKWRVGLYLAGIPDKDPSNNLFGRQVNISTRDRNLGIGAQTDEEPNVIVDVSIDANGLCETLTSSEFLCGSNGEWKLSSDEKKIRFSIETFGFTRTVRTTGSINKIYWSTEDDIVTKTASTYSIPPGFIYADASIQYGSKPGEFVMKDGLLRYEKTFGLLGASSKMITCGKFTAKMINSE